MVVWKLYSKRQKAKRGELDIFTFEDIPIKLRTQIVHILRDGLGDETEYNRKYRVKALYKEIVDLLCREYGVFTLPGANNYNRDYFSELLNFIMQEENIEKVLDAVELSFVAIVDQVGEWDYANKQGYQTLPDECIEELNSRFKESNVGFQFLEQEIVRVDTEFMYTEVTKPALRFLADDKFEGAKDEFLKAYEHFRHKNYKEALSEALKSLESTIKIICKEQGWRYDPKKDTASKLIQICLDKGLIPEFWQQHFSALRSTLESGVPTSRNRLSGHGQGPDIVEVPEHLVSYVLHQTAAAITFLIASKQAL